MKERRTIFIRCPNCGAEYHPAEIYLPNSFLGKPRDIEKEHLTGKIIDFLGKDGDNREKYICDYCNTPFKVEATVRYYTTIINEEDFNSDYVTRYKKNTLFMPEK